MSQSTTSQHDTNPMPVQCWSTVAGASQQLANILNSVLCRCQCLNRAHAETDSTMSRVGLHTQQTQNICITFVQRRPNVFDVGPTLFKCYTNVLCLLGTIHRPNVVSQRMTTKRKIYWSKPARVFSGTKARSIPRLGWCWRSGVNSGPTLKQHCNNMWINSIFRDLLAILQRPKFIFTTPNLLMDVTVTCVRVYSSKKNVRFVSRFYCIHKLVLYQFIRLESW